MDQVLITNNMSITYAKLTFDVSERWQSLPEYGVEVSDYGRVRTLKAKSFKKVSKQNGYPQVWVNKGGKGIGVTVHKLVLLAFIGPCPEGCEIDHINGIRTDNRLINLQYVTPSQNINGSVSRGHRGTNRWNARLSEDAVRTIRLLHGDGWTVGEMARQYEVSESTIYHVIRRDNWKHVD